MYLKSISEKHTFMTTGIPSSARTRLANSEPRYVSRLDLEPYQSGHDKREQDSFLTCDLWQRAQQMECRPSYTAVSGLQK